VLEARSAAAAERAPTPAVHAGAAPRSQRTLHAGKPAAAACDAAVGPNWTRQLQQLADEGGAGHACAVGVRVEMNCELAVLEAAPALAEWPLQATLTSGAQLCVDVVIAATGVLPCVDWCV
jgi:hypothetical protein